MTSVKSDLVCCGIFKALQLCVTPVGADLRQREDSEALTALQHSWTLLLNRGSVCGDVLFQAQGREQQLSCFNLGHSEQQSCI